MAWSSGHCKKFRQKQTTRLGTAKCENTISERMDPLPFSASELLETSVPLSCWQPFLTLRLLASTSSRGRPSLTPACLGRQRRQSEKLVAFRCRQGSCRALFLQADVTLQTQRSHISKPGLLGCALIAEARRSR